MVKYAIAGIGGYGWTLVQALYNQIQNEALDAKLIAAADNCIQDFPDKEMFLKNDNVQLFDDAVKMFDAVKDDCDAVIIATSIPSHAPLVKAAAERNLHIHVEKPAAATVQEVDDMLMSVRKNHVLDMVGYQSQHGDDLKYIKEILVSQKLGSIKSMVCMAGWPRKQSYYDRNGWAGRLKDGPYWVLDGPATNALNHQITNLLYLSGTEMNQYATPAALRAELYATDNFDSHNTAAMEIHTGREFKAYFICSHCTDTQFGPTIDIECEKGFVRWTFMDQYEIQYSDGKKEILPAEKHAREKLVVDFAKAVETEDRNLLGCTLEDARNTTLTINAAHESSRKIHTITENFYSNVPVDTNDQRYVVYGLDELIISAAKHKALFSDLENAPEWAAKTETFKIDYYTEFPQRFGK